MIRKTLVASVFLLTVFCISAQWLIPTVQVSQHQWQENLIKAQNFIYTSSDTSQRVIIGSSLAHRIDIDGYYNLSFSGLSIFDGLRIISHVPHPPRKVFIETNMILRREDEQFTGQLINPLLYQLKKYVPALRDGKQPVSLVVDGCYQVLKQLKNKGKVVAPEAVPINLGLFKSMLGYQINAYSKTPGSNELTYAITQLKQFVGALEAKGVEVVFFEMPVNEKLCKLPVSECVRRVFYENFSPTKYAYIVQPGCADYHTTDGVHLSPIEAVRYETYFKSAVMSMNTVAVR
jgi:hypothetical protein